VYSGEIRLRRRGVGSSQVERSPSPSVVISSDGRRKTRFVCTFENRSRANADHRSHSIRVSLNARRMRSERTLNAHELGGTESSTVTVRRTTTTTTTTRLGRATRVERQRAGGALSVSSRSAIPVGAAPADRTDVTPVKMTTTAAYSRESAEHLARRRLADATIRDDRARLSS